MLNIPENGQPSEQVALEIAKQVAKEVYKMLLRDLRIEQSRRGQLRKLPNQYKRGR
jgi:hypothetical protein